MDMIDMLQDPLPRPIHWMRACNWRRLCGVLLYKLSIDEQSNIVGDAACKIVAVRIRLFMLIGLE